MKLLRYNLPPVEINKEDIVDIENSTPGVLKVYTKDNYYCGYHLIK